MQQVMRQNLVESCASLYLWLLRKKENKKRIKKKQKKMLQHICECCNNVIGDERRQDN